MPAGRRACAVAASFPSGLFAIREIPLSPITLHFHPDPVRPGA